VDDPILCKSFSRNTISVSEHELGLASIEVV